MWFVLLSYFFDLSSLNKDIFFLFLFFNAYDCTSHYSRVLSIIHIFIASPNIPIYSYTVQFSNCRYPTVTHKNGNLAICNSYSNSFPIYWSKMFLKYFWASCFKNSQ